MSKRLLSVQKIVNLSENPSSGSAGEIYYNTVSNRYRFYNGTSWIDMVAGSGLQNVSEDTSPELGGNLDASSFNITNIDNLTFDTTPDNAGGVAALVWDDGEGTLSLGLKGGNIALQLGQENVALCYNGTGSAINKGSIVYISGAQGQRPSISLSSASSESTSSKTFGVAAENIANGLEGFVATFGIVSGLNTSLFTEGASLWLSTESGQLTTTPPTQPNHSVFIGYCLKSHVSSGRIFVNPQNGYEIQELHNVLITSVQNKDFLAYDSTTSLWKNLSFTEEVQDTVGSMFNHGSHVNITASYNDITGQVILNGSASAGVSLATVYWLGV